MDVFDSFESIITLFIHLKSDDLGKSAHLRPSVHVMPEQCLAELIEEHICIWPTKSLFL